jgi:hypothetical protein
MHDLGQKAKALIPKEMMKHRHYVEAAQEEIRDRDLEDLEIAT